jgi:MFS family permease
MKTMEAGSQRFAALGYKNFRLLWSGLIVSNMGTWMQNVASGWLVLQLTNSPLWLGLLGFSFAVPMVILPPFAGAVVDRVNRIRLLFFTQSMQMLNVLVLALLTWFGRVEVWHILVNAFVGAMLLAFDNPARQALFPDLVAPRDLLNALSLNSATYTGAALVGPAIAGILLEPLGAGTLFFLNGVSYLAVIVALAMMRDVRTHSGGKPGSLGSLFQSGLSYVRSHRLILALLILSSVAAIFGRSYQSLLPAFSRDIWHAGAEGYGLLLAAAGGGALVGAFGLAYLKQVPRQGALMLVNGLLFSIILIAFSLSPSFLLGLLLLFFAGITSTVFLTMIATFIQLSVPNEMRGRVMSLYTVTLIGLPSLGAMGSGAVAEWLGGVEGAPHAVLIGAIILALILLAVLPMFWKRDLPQRQA